MLNLSNELGLKKAGYKNIVGIDEAGRGPWAGPVVVAGVILPDCFDCTLLNDSKKLNFLQREELFMRIELSAQAITTKVLTHNLIDRIGILNAVKQGMQAVAKTLKPDFLLIDAVNINYPDIPQNAIIKGDAKVASIAAASIVAKVTRDRLMLKFAKKYPQYGFENHKGYGTAEHQAALEQYGICTIHRKSYAPIQKLILNLK